MRFTFQRPRPTLEWLRQWLQNIEQRFEQVRVRFEVVETWSETARLRILALEDRTNAQIELLFVEAVIDLPSGAPPRTWYRVQTGTVAERATIYVGNGVDRPLSKLTPTSL